eukprot:jgi/Picsp_1/5/NSC_00005-R1_squamosa promoter-binding-like protein 7
MQSTLPCEEEHWSRKEYEWSPSSLVAECKVQETDSNTSISADDTRNAKKKKKDFSVMCQIEGCTNVCETSYYRKYKICQEHGKSPAVSIKGEVVRFCQKCAKFHSLVEFDDNRRSCRAMLVQHNRRRRLAKKSQKFQAEKQNRRQSLVKAILAESSLDSRGTSECKSAQIRDKLVGDESSCQDTDPHLVTCSEDQEDRMIEDVDPRSNADVEMVSAGVLNTGREVCLDDCYQIANFFTSMPGNDTNMGNPYMDAHDRDILLSNEDLQIPDRVLEYDSGSTELRISMKFYDGKPENLPCSMLSDFLLAFPGASNIEGCIRPGCTHLTVQMRIPTSEYADSVESRDEAKLLSIFSESWAKSASIKKGLLFQIEDKSSLLTSGGVIEKLDPVYPEISLITPCCILKSDPVQLDVFGNGIGSSKCAALCRQHGEHLTVSIIHDGEEDEVDSILSSHVSSSSVPSEVDSYESKRSSISCVLDCSYYSTPESVESLETRENDLPISSFLNDTDCVYSEMKTISIIGLNVGVSEIELVCEDSLSQPYPLLVLPNEEAVSEVRKLVHCHQHTTWAKSFLRDVGLVLRHLYCRPVPKDQMESLEYVASTTVSFCLNRGCSALARLLEPALRDCRESGDIVGKGSCDLGKTSDFCCKYPVGGILSNRSSKSASLVQAIEVARSRLLLEEMKKIQRKTQYIW